MHIREHNFTSLKERYGKNVPALIEQAQRYEQFDFVVFEEDAVPKIVFTRLTIDARGVKLHQLSAISCMLFDLPLKTMKRYRAACANEKTVLAYDLPPSVHISEKDASIVRYSPIELPAIVSEIDSVELGDEDADIGEQELAEIIKQSPGISISLGYTNTVKQANFARYLAEVHNYQLSRRIYFI